MVYDANLGQYAQIIENMLNMYHKFILIIILKIIIVFKFTYYTLIN